MAPELLERAGIDKEDFEAAAFEEVEERDPEASGGLHGDGCDSASSEPVGEAIKVGGESREGAHRLGIDLRGDGDEVLGGADINTSGVRMKDVKGEGGLGHGITP